MAVTAGKIGSTTTLTWHGDSPLELTRIGSVILTATKVDSTTLGTADFYKEFIPGLIDPGDVDIEGLFRPDDAGTILLKTDMEARTSQTFTIAFPTALSTTTWTGTAYITAFSAGDATPEGIIPFKATMSIVGKPTLNITLSAGMTALTGAEDSGAITIEPTVDVATYSYVSLTSLTAAWITLSPVGAGMTFDITALGVTHTVVTGGTTGHIVVGGADTTTPVYIKCYATAGGQSPRNYTLWVTYP